MLIVGEGPERQGLTELARVLGVSTTFTGESSDVPGLLSAMDILVLPSLTETFGLAAIEGLAAGLPVFYATCPALDELPPGSAPGARRLPADTVAFGSAIELAARHGASRLAPPPAVRHYDIARLAGRIETLYARLTRVPDHMTQPRNRGSEHAE